MSRRSGKRRGKSGNRLLGKGLLVLLGAGVILLVSGYGILRRYLHSDAFRKFLSAEVSEKAGLQGEFAPFRWEGLAVDTDFFEATGAGWVTGMKADGLHTEVGLGGVRRGAWEIRASSIRHLEIGLDARDGRASRTAAGDEIDRPGKRVKGSAWLPKEVEFQGLDVQEVTAKAMFDEGLATARHVQLHVEQAGAKEGYRAVISGGTIHLPSALVPELRVDQVRLRYQDRRVFLTEAGIDAWSAGRIEATGEWDIGSGQYSVEGDANGLKCEEILSPDWSKRLTGDLASGFTVKSRQGDLQASGKLVIQNGVLTALPMLDALAAYADTRRFRVLPLNAAHADWHWEKGGITLTNLVIHCEGLVRLEGSMNIRGRQIDGIFRLGLAPGTLATIPGAETDVFTAGERGLLWAPLRISGTLDDPKEDLTERLVAAAGLRMFDSIPETGEKVIKFSQSLLDGLSTKAPAKGAKILEEGTKTVREIGGILDGILGGGEGRKAKEDE